MKVIKIFNFKKVLSFLLVFTLFFSQNSMMVFADILNTKSTVKVSSNLDNKTDNEKDKSNQKNVKNCSELTTSDSLSKGIENNSSSNFTEFEKMQAGSYSISENGIYPFTGDWGTKHTLESQKSNGEKNTLEKEISTYENIKKGYYYKQLDAYKQVAYDLYVYVLKVLDKNEYFDVSGYNLYPTDFYGVLTAVIHENPELFWGYDMDIEIDNTGKVKRIKYETPFTQNELDDMKVKFKKCHEEVLNTIRSNLGQNPTKLKIAKEIHDYLVSHNHYGSEVCPEETHGDKEAHLGCKGAIIEHTAYGALVKSDRYGVVCEGFSSAFVLLCKDLNIEALYDAGFNDAYNSLHAWNYVKMDDEQWYLVDLTYDNGVFKKNGIVYDLFLAGIENPSFKFRHSEYMGSYLNHKYKGQEYDIPKISKDSYIKFEVIYPNTSGVARNVFIEFSDLLDDFEKRDLQGNHTIILKDDYTLTEEEVNQLKNYKVTNQQKFCIRADLKESNKRCIFKSKTNKMYLPVSVYLYDITYDIESTYVGGNSIIVGQNVSNGANECSIYLFGKEDNTKSNTIYITSGRWKNIVGAYPNIQSVDKSTHNGNVSINIQGARVENMILSQGIVITGNIDVKISKDGIIENFTYGNEIHLNEGKNLNISISGATVRKFKQNNEPIFANTTIDVTDGIVQNLVGPYVFDKNSKCTTTININDNIDVESIIDFDNLVIGNGKLLNVTDELDYNKTNSNKRGIVIFNGNSTLKLPKSISKVGSLSSIGESNSLLISKEDAFLNINEKQGPQGTPIAIKYDVGLVAKNGYELIRYKYRDDIHLDNFINEVNKRFQLYDDDSTFSIRLFLSNYPIKLVCKDGESFEFSCLYNALDYLERRVNENVSEVKFYINENYEMSEEDLTKLKSYSSTVNNQKFVFTSENESVLSTSDDVTFSVTNKLGEIEFINITLDFDNKNIFAAGNHLIMSESVKMTPRSKINLYGGLPGKEVTNSRLTLNGGTFNNVYGGGLAANGIVSNDVDISLDKNVLVKGSVYGGAGYDKTGSSKAHGTTTINLLGGTVLGDIIGGGKNDKSPIYNNIVINYGGTKVNNIYGLMRNLTPRTANIDIDININKNAKLNTIAGFNNLNVRPGVTLNVSDILKYDAGISSGLDGEVKLDGGSNLYIPNSTDENNRKIGKLESVGFNNNIYIDKGKYLLISSNINPAIGSSVNISYYSGEPALNDNLVKFYDGSLALISNENFKTNYNFNISADTESGFLYLAQKTYKVNLYTGPNTLYKTDEIRENGEYTFEAPEKVKGKKFIRWRDKDQEGVYYTAGQKIRVNRDISVEAEYQDVDEYTVTLKVDGVTYKKDYVEAGKSYTFTAAPPKEEKYFIGWEPEGISPNNLYSSSLSMIKSATHIQEGTTIIVNSDLTYDADYGTEVKYDVDYGDGNGNVKDVYYEGGSIKVPSTPPIGIKIPFGKVFGGFKAIFTGIANVVGGILSVMFKPGESITIQPGIKLEAVWVDELNVKIYDENGKLSKTEKIGKGFEYTTPVAPKIEYKEFLYWQDTLNSNNRYNANQKIIVNSDMELKPVYKNTKVVSLSLDSIETKYFADFSSALNYAKDKNAKLISLEFLEDYSLTNQDINTLMNFNNKNNASFVIKGCNKSIKLKINDSISLSGDTEFKDIVLDYGKTTAHGIYARGHKLEMGQNIEMKGTGSPILIGGENGKDVDRSEIIVRSGRYSAIYGGGYSERSGVHGNITIELYDGEVTGDIYGGSQNTGLISTGTTNINLFGGTVGGVVSGASNLLGLENSNDINIRLLGTKLKTGEVYGGYVEFAEDSDNTGVTTVTVGQNYTLNKLVGFTKLDINQGKTLEVTQVLNYKGGIRVTEDSGQISLNGNSKLIVPPAYNASDRQAGWLKSNGQDNEIVVYKDKYLSLTSEKSDEIDSNKIILDLKNKETSKAATILLKYKNNTKKADATKFKKGQNIQSELVLKDDKENGTVYFDEKDLIKIIKPDKKSLKFKTMQSAIQNVQSDNQVGTYTIKLLEDYTLTDSDINTLRDFNRSGVNFVINGLNENTELNAALKINNSIMLSTDTKFENIVLDYGIYTGHGIYARGHRLEMGENITMKGTGSPILIGGENGKDVNKSEIIVRSGRYSAIYGGGYSERSGVHGNVTIELYDGEVTGDIYAGSQNTGLISTGTTNINLRGGTVGGLVCGTSKLLGLENSNDVNIRLLGTTLNRGEVYGGYVKLSEDEDDTGMTTVTVGQDYTLNKLVGFTKLDINEGKTLEVTQVLNYKGGIRVTEDSGQISLNGNSKLIVPPAYNASDRQVGWLKSNGQNNEIVVYKDKYLSLTSERADEIDNNKIILNLKNKQTSKESSILLKYENNKEKADTTKFKKGENIQSELVLKDDKVVGNVYADEKDLLKIIKPNEQSFKFKTMQDAIRNIQSDNQVGMYTIKLLEDYTLTDSDINALRAFNRSGVKFVINGSNENTDLKAVLKINNSIMLSTDTKFENIVLDYGIYTGHGIYARGHRLEMGENITMKGTGSPILIGGENGKDVNKSEIIVRSGRYSAIYGGGFTEYSGVHGNITIELYGGDVTGDIYAGSQNTGLISCGETNINLRGGTVEGVVSGASKLLGLENSNDVNIQLLGTKLKEVYGGYVKLSEESDNTGVTTVTVGQNYTLNKLVGFTKLDINQGKTLEVTQVLNYKGGIRVTENSGEICLNGNSKLIVPSTDDVSNRQVGWINSVG